VFLKVYKKLADAPDPSPLLLQAAEHQRRIDALQAFQIENEKLKKTLEEYHAEFAHVKNQGKFAIFPWTRSDQLHVYFLILRVLVCTTPNNWKE
jgi:hypothetical protein